MGRHRFGAGRLAVAHAGFLTGSRGRAEGGWIRIDPLDRNSRPNWLWLGTCAAPKGSKFPKGTL
jgi:hypothetical protein